MGDLEELVSVFEIVVDTTTIFDEWNDGDYLEAGLYAGKGSVNAFYTIYGLISKYFVKKDPTIVWKSIILIVN